MQNNTYSVNYKGEFENERLGKTKRLLRKKDNLMLKGFVATILMIICFVIDAASFYGLFSLMSYDSPLMLVIQIGVLLFAFDVVASYIGIDYKRIRQGLSRDKMTFGIAVGVFVIAVALNTVLRITAVKLMTPDSDSAATSFIESEEEEETDEIDPASKANVIFGICCPILTSVGLFYITYVTYDPLENKSEREEQAIEDAEDAKRKYQDILNDYDAEPDFKENILKEDEERYCEMQKINKNMALKYCDYVREKLKEHLGDPVSNNYLSAERCDELVERMIHRINLVSENEGVPADVSPINSQRHAEVSNG